MKTTYAEKNLMPNEKLIGLAKIHWYSFLFPTIYVLVGAGLLIHAVLNASEPLPIFLGVVGIAMLIYGTIGLIGAIVFKLTAEVALTSEKVFVKGGFIKRFTRETMLKDIESLMVDETFMGRIFGFGDVVAKSKGGDSQIMPMIQVPFEFKDQIKAQLSELSAKA